MPIKSWYASAYQIFININHELINSHLRMNQEIYQGQNIPGECTKGAGSAVHKNTP